MLPLHDDFAEAIDCDVGEFQLTPDKCKDIMSTMKKKIRRIVNDYSKSGNGSDMAKFDGDTDEEGEEIEDGDDESGPVKGHFNQERSIRRAARRGITLVNGDDRRNFLKGNRLVPGYIVAYQLHGIK